ncbi:MAG: SOS response-associated peptidase [Acidimicrobiales bacterium]
MCGRIALYSEPDRLSRVFDAALVAGVDRDDLPRFNVGPTTEILGIVGDGGPPDTAGSPGRLLDRFRWGLVPSWSTEASSGGRLFNARAESVSGKASFREAFRRRRAVIPADGFFEWHKRQDGPGQPHFFTRADGQPLALAGLWEVWRDPLGPDDRSAWVRSCAIITTTAGPDVAPVHERMPVVLEPAAIDAWLDPTEDPEVLRSLMQPAPAGTLVHHRVDQRVGNVANDEPGLIAPVEADEEDVVPLPASAPTLFD